LNNGRTIPQVGLGCYHVEEQGAIESALDAGYMHFDTAGFYKNEKWIGKEIQSHSFMRAFPRTEYFVCSKIPPGFANYKKAPTIIASSVKSVGIDYLDCMLLLWPGT
jgi:diketogulonate reductase-like aldo/keto reductase